MFTLCFRLQRRALRVLQVSPSQRCISSSPVLRNATTTSTELKAVTETQDIKALDSLLKVVSEKANPAYHNIMPMRTPILWSEALLNAASTSKSSEVPPVEAPASEQSLPPRHMHDTYSEIILPFASSPELLEQYTNAWGGLRIGMLMEHLDSLAGSISYKHMLGPGVETLGRINERGFYIVTASVDRLDVLAPLLPVRDIRLSGIVIHTGRSSMEVAVKMEAFGASGVEDTLLLGRFSMVCRDARTHKARPVNPLILGSAEETALCSMGENAKKRRQTLALRSLSRVPPSSAEAADLHAMHLQHGQDDHPSSHYERVWMGDTHLEKTMLMFPQERNVHQKVFGGYLMRLAYELGFANASLFTRSHVTFMSLDSISFAKPVPIGSILRLTSQILHTTSGAAHVGVQANVVDVRTGHEETTNDFRFTWRPDDGAAVVRGVVPNTYREAMLWLEGKRALEMGDQIRGERSSK
ncbi:Thioesterase/thiol ester dehydrase-isomerase [Rhizopogon salebrosus TDB-379]|nr:Thioesterase/thiol ester dehydrase-isomerase [Rhizopogon salebrosus TDB-379]